MDDKIREAIRRKADEVFADAMVSSDDAVTCFKRAEATFNLRDLQRVMDQMRPLALEAQEQERLLLEWCAAQRRYAIAEGIQIGWLAAGGDTSHFESTAGGED